MEIERLNWLFEEHYKEEKQKFEILAHTISVGYARTQSKKKIQLFEEEKKVAKITQDERMRKWDGLKSSFGK